MNIRWTEHAAEQLRQIVHYISHNNPQAAARVAKQIYTQVAELANMPHRGRPGSEPGTRELVMTSWPT